MVATARPCRVIGHRGARGLFPENTLEGFRAALALGVRALELDVGMTADGIVVVSHDPALNPDITRDAAGQWLDGAGPSIRALPAAALARFDVGRIRAGTAYAAAFPAQVGVDGARIPHLIDVLALGADLIIELKTDPNRPARTAPPEAMAEAVAAAIDGAPARPAGGVIVESFDWRGPRHLRRLRPALPIALLTSAATVADARLWWGGPAPEDFGGSVPRAIAAEGAAFWAPEYQTLSAAQVHEAQTLGLGVLAWTVNDPAAMRRLIAWGVDGLITDRPDVALALPGAVA